MRHADDSIEARARRRVARKIGFYIHALVFVLVNAGLYVINTTVGGYRWNLWPLLGWGIGLAVHGIVTFVSLQGEGLRRRMIDSEIEALKRREQGNEPRPSGHRGAGSAGPPVSPP